MSICVIEDEYTGEKRRAIKLSEEDAKDISALYKEVWPKAYEYPKEWREKRAMSEAEVKSEMDHGYYFFGVRIEGKLVGVYKASITDRGCFGEQQVVTPEYSAQGVASAMYEQFYEFAKANKCKVNYVNILAGNKPCERAMKKFNFYKTGEPWEQSKGMLVQTYERKVGV
ncbi:MAG TPA: GNAT family N-acetyltransferase [Methanophagales archaeon]|nr:GNAT family N-acetyltransferase [Methanophagales archaeon]